MKFVFVVKLRFHLEILLFWKNPWYSSMMPVMTHSSPPMAESIPSIISMKKKMTDLRFYFDFLDTFSEALASLALMIVSD